MIAALERDAGQADRRSEKLLQLPLSGFTVLLVLLCLVYGELLG